MTRNAAKINPAATSGMLKTEGGGAEGAVLNEAGNVLITNVWRETF